MLDLLGRFSDPAMFAGSNAQPFRLFSKRCQVEQTLPCKTSATCGSRQRKSVRYHKQKALAAAAPVLDSAVEDSAAPTLKQPASTLPASWSASELEDEQISHELRARRQRSNSLAQASKAAEAGLPGLDSAEQPDRQRRGSKRGRPSRSRQSLRTRSSRGASLQGHTQTQSNPASPSSQPLTAEQEVQVCKAIQVQEALLCLVWLQVWLSLAKLTPLQDHTSLCRSEGKTRPASW